MNLLLVASPNAGANMLKRSLKSITVTIVQTRTTYVWKSITFDSPILIFPSYFYTTVR